MRKEGSKREEAETNEIYAKKRASDSQSQGQGRDSGMEKMTCQGLSLRQGLTNQ